MRVRAQISKYINSYYQFNYPEEFGVVIRGDGYWLSPIKYIRVGRCYVCGKFKNRREVHDHEASYVMDTPSEYVAGI